jgi:hypothetical protein
MAKLGVAAGTIVCLLNVLACGGSTSSNRDLDTGALPNEANSDGGGGGTSSDAGTTGCAMRVVAMRRVCVPRSARANAPLTFEAGPHACAGCGSTVGACIAVVTGTTIRLSAEETSCKSGAPCAAICAESRVTCAIPPLTPGSYTIETEEGPRATTHTLVVGSNAADAAATSCVLDSSPTLSQDDYSRSCGADGDCEVIPEDNPCICSCQRGAIAKTSHAKYASDLEAARSHCEPENPAGGPRACQCPAVNAKCIAGTCTAVAE